MHTQATHCKCTASPAQRPAPAHSGSAAWQQWCWGGWLFAPAARLVAATKPKECWCLRTGGAQVVKLQDSNPAIKHPDARIAQGQSLNEHTMQEWAPLERGVACQRHCFVARGSRSCQALPGGQQTTQANPCTTQSAKQHVHTHAYVHTNNCVGATHSVSGFQ